MSEHPQGGAVSREILSALADGQASASEAAQAAAAWRQQPDARATWHAYHLIGDVLRSPESVAASDSERFLQRLRDRMAEEPVVLAPQAAQVWRHEPAAPATQDASASPLRRRMWAGPAAVAASFALIVGVLTSQIGGPGGAASGDQLARSGTGWAEASLSTQPGLSLAAGASFNNRGDQVTSLLPRDPRLEQVMTVQRPLPNPPSTFSDPPGLIRQAVYSTP
ncbi:MAG: sigma-E factor negative regulatory protein [Burkholderiales bacterium]|nr:sigma-E factor negative regulatory protein [Burkholderiales bacterium]MBH2017355.1 sigma-E factor negative regulatory protein [Burkholderiales bacterium]